MEYTKSIYSLNSLLTRWNNSFELSSDSSLDTKRIGLEKLFLAHTRMIELVFSQRLKSHFICKSVNRQLAKLAVTRQKYLKSPSFQRNTVIDSSLKRISHLINEYNRKYPDYCVQSIHNLNRYLYEK